MTSAFLAYALLAHCSARALWADRIKTAETQGMEPLVEPTLARWLTAPFRERRKDVVDKVATMIRSARRQPNRSCLRNPRESAQSPP